MPEGLLFVDMARRSALALLAAACVVGIAACGSDEEPVASVAEPRSSRTATPVPTTTATATSAPAGRAPTPEPSRADAAPGVVPSAVTPADPLTPVPAQETAAPIGQPPCRAADLTVVDADTLVLPDVVQEVFVLRTSGRDCELEGYPDVRLLDASGAPLAVRVTRGGAGLPASRPAPVTLSRTTSLSFVVSTPRDGTCTDASAVDVTLPGTTTAIRAATALPVCGSAGVSPVERRTDDE